MELLLVLCRRQRSNDFNIFFSQEIEDPQSNRAPIQAQPRWPRQHKTPTTRRTRLLPWKESMRRPRCGAFARAPTWDIGSRLMRSARLGAPENRPDIKEIPDAEDGALLIKFVEKEVAFIKDKPELADLIRRCGLTDTDLCALMSIKLEEPFALYRFLNAWLQGQRRDSHVRDKVGPFFKLVYRAMEKLPKKRVPAARAVIVNDIPALKRTYDNYMERLKPGKVLSFWSPASFSTKDDVVNREEFVGGPSEAAIVYMCGELEGVDMEPFKPRGLNAEYEVLPLCPAVFRVTASVKIGAKLVVSLSQDLEEHAEQAYVAPTAQPQPSPPAAPAAVPDSPLRNVAPPPPAPAQSPQAHAAHVDPHAAVAPAAALPTPQGPQQNGPLSPRSVSVVEELRDRSRYPYSEQLATTRISTGTTYRDAAMALIEKYHNSDGWWALGRSTTATERVTANGRPMSKRDCYVEALTHDAKNSLAWNNLSVTMTAPERIVVNGETLTREECAQRGR